eukprot:Em0004g1201a
MAGGVLLQWLAPGTEHPRYGTPLICTGCSLKCAQATLANDRIPLNDSPALRVVLMPLRNFTRPLCFLFSIALTTGCRWTSSNYDLTTETWPAHVIFQNTFILKLTYSIQKECTDAETEWKKKIRRLFTLCLFFCIVIAASAGAPCSSVTCRSTAPAQNIPNATENDTIRSIQCTLQMVD